MGLSVIPAQTRPLTLADRYSLDEGRVFLSGVQALVRLLLEQHRADRRAGLSTASLISGYQGSPLAGFDRELARLGSIASEHNLVLRPGVNEELGATAVWGSQIAATLPGPRYDGVVGVWYGKAPGVDRSADAIRHGNFVGADPQGGVLALCGDDPASKSSTIPSASEALLAALHVPVLAPASVQELLDLGRHAIACSRASGLWAALKVLTAVADATATVDIGLDRVRPVIPTLEWEGRPYVHRPSAHLLAPESLEMERTLFGVRLDLAKLYGRLNNLNPVTRDDVGARIGIVAGASHSDVMQALADVDPEGVVPLRVLKVGMLYPLDEQVVRSFAAGLDEIIVVEEKGPFLEPLVRDALYRLPDAPFVFGQRDGGGAPLVPAAGVVDADVIAGVVGRRLLAHHDLPAVRARLDQLEAVAARPSIDLGARRAAFFCSGCPHNRSTVAEDDTIVGAGIGCHTMVMLTPARRGHIGGITQMGGEGAQWIGAAPFVEPRHFVQNIGDGTFHHSGSLAIRAAVAANLDITYKLLYNSFVAMTGGQPVEGQLSIANLAWSLEADGVKRIIVTTDDPSRYRHTELPKNTKVRDRSQLLDAQRELASVRGVTVLIHEQPCAAELRRARKRGKAPKPAQHVLINERVCEGCGDCGRKSNCLSVEPLDTEFGRKTRIHEASCNQDFSCLEGDCPSFLTVIPLHQPATPGTRLPEIDLPEPEPRVPQDDVRIRLAGIGGTGVVTVSQVLGMAALIDGKHALGLDQTGLSQKAGPVVSDVRITTDRVEGSAIASVDGLDLLLCLDVLGATAANLRGASSKRTLAATSTSVSPTGEMVSDPNAATPDSAAAERAIAKYTRAAENVSVDALAISEALFGDNMPANIVVLGAAWQQGAIPLTHAAIHEALRLNGASVEANIAAFEWGRACAFSPDVERQLLERTAPMPQPHPLINEVTDAGDELRRLLTIRVDDLIGWGGKQAAANYVHQIARVRALEAERLPDSTAFTEAVAKGLHKLMAYKDEYEVARLHVQAVRALDPGTKVMFHLHPPLLRAIGLKRKLRLGRWFIPCLRALQHGRRLRGTRLDPFGYAHVRRLERELPAQYLVLVDRALERLSPEILSVALEIAVLPDVIRGYEDIKLAGVERFHTEAQRLLGQLNTVATEPGSRQ